MDIDLDAILEKYKSEEREITKEELLALLSRHDIKDFPPALQAYITSRLLNK